MKELLELFKRTGKESVAELRDALVSTAKGRAGKAWDELSGDVREGFEETAQDALVLWLREQETGVHESREWQHIESQFAGLDFEAALIARDAFVGVLMDLAQAVAGIATGGASNVAAGIVATVGKWFRK